MLGVWSVAVRQAVGLIRCKWLDRVPLTISTLTRIEGADELIFERGHQGPSGSRAGELGSREEGLSRNRLLSRSPCPERLAGERLPTQLHAKRTSQGGVTHAGEATQLLKRCADRLPINVGAAS